MLPTFKYKKFIPKVRKWQNVFKFKHDEQKGKKNVDRIIKIYYLFGANLVKMIII